MKGIILAGGNGTRLRPLTRCINKNLLPVGDKSMILYPIEQMRNAGIREILITCGAEHMGDIVDLLRGGSEFGVELTYRVQEEPKGIAHAIALGETFIGDNPFCVILGDNVFDAPISAHLKLDTPGMEDYFRHRAAVFCKEVPDPRRFGVVEWLGDLPVPKAIHEKPEIPPSSDAVIGVYVYPPDAFKFIKSLAPSTRGEYEVSDLNNCYIKEARLDVYRIDGYWIDCGTLPALKEANLWAYTKE